MVWPPAKEKNNPAVSSVPQAQRVVQSSSQKSHLQLHQLCLNNFELISKVMFRFGHHKWWFKMKAATDLFLKCMVERPNQNSTGFRQNLPRS
jgi:hypothetical protein